MCGECSNKYCTCGLNTEYGGPITQKKLIHKKTNDPETWEAGDIIHDKDGFIRTVLRADGTGDIRTFDVSFVSRSLQDNNLKKYGKPITTFELKEFGYSLYTPKKEKTKPVYTPDEAIDKLRELGHDCEIKK